LEKISERITRSREYTKINEISREELFGEDPGENFEILRSRENNEISRGYLREREKSSLERISERITRSLDLERITRSREDTQENNEILRSRENNEISREYLEEYTLINKSNKISRE